jgi:hypothetical protein
MAEKGHDFLLHLSGLLCKNYFQLFLIRKTTAGAAAPDAGCLRE